MLYTGRGSKVSGLGLAVSDDLMAWRKVGDGPVVLLGKPFPGEWEGKPLQWVGLADPYLYPEPVDGWYYLVLNSQVVGEPISTSGCLTTMRSHDLQTWEPHSVLAFPRLFERLETPQLWRHGNRWYLYFGGAHDHGVPERFLAEAPEEVSTSRAAATTSSPPTASRDHTRRQGSGGSRCRTASGATSPKCCPDPTGKTFC